jgi:hypothetical protein
MKLDELNGQIKLWISQMQHVASELPDTGACAVASALDLWQWTAAYVVGNKGEAGPTCGPAELQALADSLGGLLSARALVLATHEQLGAVGAEKSKSSQGIEALQLDLCHGQTSRAASLAGQVCAELVCGSQIHPKWDASCHECVVADEVDALEVLMPGISYGARLTGDVLESDGSHPDKAGPCVQMGKLAGFLSRRKKLDGCLSGSWLARQRAVQRLQEMA